MRVLAFILALLGGIACAVLGIIRKDAFEGSAEFQRVRMFASDLALAELLCPYSLLAAFPLASIGGLLALYRCRVLGVLLLLVSAGAPLFFTWRVMDTG